VSADLMTPKPLEAGIVSLQVASDESPYIETGFKERFAAAVEAIRADASIRVVLIQGGSRYFCAGASRASLLRADAGREVPRYAAELPLLVLDIPVPTIAVMAGHAIGGGFALGLLCDLALLAEESLYGMNFMALGFTPGMGATLLLEEAFGPRLAHELLFTGRVVKGRDLPARGAKALHRAEIGPRAISLAEEIAAAPREALLHLKAMLAGRRRERLQRALSEERRSHEALFALGDTARHIQERYSGSLFPGEEP
jgi:4-carboxy-3-alkylbut-2-enoyl-[acp] decarboxylase